MAQLIVRNLEDDVRDRLRELAEENGRSMEEEVREILRAAALRASGPSAKRLGTRISERFERYGLDAEIEELRDHPAKPADLDE
jgi:plasmid stability protein